MDLAASSADSYAVFAALLSLERLAYGVVWKQPSAVSKAAKIIGMAAKEPELIFTWVRAFKLVQIYVFSTWYYARYGATLPSTTWWQLALGLPCLLLGQVLNVSVWRSIGIDGVCYGVKFGRHVPWVTGWPYSVCAHPQYTGAILTVWGMFVFSAAECPDWWVLPVVETLLYASSMLYLEA